jgi:uncharacterized protein YebE (UPF0316 family)
MPGIFREFAVLGYFFIFIARICDVSLQTLRMILMVRGERLKAACIGFFEVIIYVIALNIIFDNLNNIGNLLAYAFGFATGNFVGGFVEEKLAIGIQFIQLITMKEPLKLAELLRQQDYGVTVLEGAGRSGPQFVLEVLLERKRVKGFSQEVAEWDEAAFMIVTDAKKYRGGIMKKPGMAVARKGK